MDQKYKKRINNLQFSICSYLGNMPENPSWEIRLYYPNSYYGRESDFIKDGDYYKPNNSDTYRFVFLACNPSLQLHPLQKEVALSFYPYN